MALDFYLFFRQLRLSFADNHTPATKASHSPVAYRKESYILYITVHTEVESGLILARANLFMTSKLTIGRMRILWSLDFCVGGCHPTDNLLVNALQPPH